MKYPSIFIPLAALALVLLAGSCGSRSGSGVGSSSSSSSGADGKDAVALKATHRLTMPKPPVALTSDTARLDYVVSHYWDSFDRRDTTWITDTVALEQAFANWTGVLRFQPEAQAASSITEFLRSMEVCTPVRDRVLEVAERYFYDPNSPLRSEALYIPVLRYMIASPTIEEAYKIRPRAQLEMVLKNRPGMPSADFAYTTPDGKSQRLSGIRAEHTLLLFYNPGCPDCARVEEFIAKSGVLAPLIASGAVKILAVYPEDDLDTWRKHIPYLPQNWTIAHDKGMIITNQSLYELRAIPSLYLLDKNKRVILKDAPVEQIEAWIAAHEQEVKR